MLNPKMMKSSLLCTKYTGLKFYNVFQTNNFIFLPKELPEEVNNGIPLDNDFYSCKYDKDSEFYVLLKEEKDGDVSLQQQLTKFKFLEAILMFLFTNKISRILLFTLDFKDEEYNIKKLVRYNTSEQENEHAPLLWKNIILIDFLTQVLDDSFNLFNELRDKQEEFAEELYFSIGMYLKGKQSDETLNIIISLWISLEVFSTITIIYIYKTDKNLIKSGIKKFQNYIEENAADWFDKDKSKCWEPLKERFYEHIAHKITPHLPIKQKINILVEKELENENIVLPLNMTYRILINFLYVIRNNVVHNGKFPKIIGKDLSRKQALLSMMIERLILKVLRIPNLNFFQFGDHEYLFMKFKGEIKEYYSDYSGAIRSYLYSKILFPSIEKNDWYSEGGDIDNKLRNMFHKINMEYSSLIVKLNQISDRIVDLFLGVIRMELRSEETSEIFSIQFKEISSRGLRISMLDEEKSFFSLTKAWIEEREIRFHSLDNPTFTISFSGYIEDIPERNLLYLRMIPNQLEIESLST